VVFSSHAELVGVDDGECGMGADTTLKDDIAYMRGLAEAGRKGPVLGASILFSCGLIYSLAAVASWLIHSGRLAIDLPFPGVEWWAAAAVQIPTVIVLSRRLGGRSGQSNAASRLFGVIWSSMGFAIFAFAVAIALIHWRFQQPMVWMAMPAIVMALYGAGWSMNAVIVRRAWMHAVAVVSYLAAILTAFMVDLPNALGLLAYAGVIFAIICVPGLILMREPMGGESAA
jgi:hypothetical protein